MKNEQLIDITKDTFFSLITDSNVILPQTYQKRFVEVALSKGNSFEDIKQTIVPDSEDCTFLREVGDKTIELVGNARSLTNESIKAIEINDLGELREILAKMQSLEKELEVLSNEVYKDGLTSVFNRKWFEEKFLSNGVATFDGVIGFIDLKNFKGINDNLGHNIGDKVLKLMSKDLKKALNDAHIIRFGGDEFIVLLEDPEKEKILHSKLLKLQSYLDKKNFYLKDSNGQETDYFKIQFDFGTGTFDKEKPFEHFLTVVDKKMYENKMERKKLS